MRVQALILSAVKGTRTVNTFVPSVPGEQAAGDGLRRTRRQRVNARPQCRVASLDEQFAFRRPHRQDSHATLDVAGTDGHRVVEGPSSSSLCAAATKETARDLDHRPSACPDSSPKFRLRFGWRACLAARSCPTNCPALVWWPQRRQEPGQRIRQGSEPAWGHADSVRRDRGRDCLSPLVRTATAPLPAGVVVTLTPLLTDREVADLLVVKPDTVRRWAASGQLPSVRLGGRLLRFRREDVEFWISSQATSTTTKLTLRRRPGSLRS